MTRWWKRAMVVTVTISALWVLDACAKENEPPLTAKSEVAQGPGQEKGDGPGQGKKGRGAVREAMVKLAKGPNALNSIIGEELNAEMPPWDKLQPQTKEYTDLAASIAKHDPPKGSKESWIKLTTAFAESAATLDRSVQSKDRDAALTAHKALSGSCMACHQQHKGGKK